MPRLTRINGKPITEITALVLRQMAAECRAREEESFQRSDTDGFLSQWASSLTARLYDEQAKLTEAGGLTARFILIEATTGMVVSRAYQAGGKWIDGKHGRFCTKSQWVLPREWRTKVGRYSVPAGENSRLQKAFGLRETTEKVPGVAAIGGHGTGLSGAANAFVAVFPLDEVTDY